MSRWLGLRARMRHLVRRQDAEQRMTEELRFHLEMETARYVREGFAESEARRRAMIAFGGVEGVKEEMRAQRRLPVIEEVVQDVRYAVRTLWRDRTFALVAVVTLALGIAASTATFSVLRGIVLRELPVPRAGDVAVLWTAAPTGTAEHLPLSWAELSAYRQHTRAFASVAGVTFQGAVDVVMLDGSTPIPLAATWVTGDFFPLLGTAPVQGRMLEPADDAPGAAPVMVISHALWQQQFGGAVSVLGRTLTWNGTPYEIVGVLPRGFAYPKHVQAWMPVLPAFPATREANASPADAMMFDVVGRLHPGQRMQVAREEFDAFLRVSDEQRPAAVRERRAVLATLPDLVFGDIRGTLWAATATVGLLLLIACLNVANLLLIRGAVRTQELAIRAALGAGRGRLVRQLLTEASVLSVVGGVLGTGLAIVVIHVLVRLAPPQLPQRDMIAVDTPVLLAAAGITAAAALCAGLMPALSSVRRDLGTWLRGGRHVFPGVHSTSLLRPALVVGQVSLAVLVIICSGLFVRSLRTLQQIELGFDEDRLTIVETMLSSDAPPDRPQMVALQEAMIERVAALPGVIMATAMPKPPFSAQGGWLATFSAEGQSAEEFAVNPVVNFEVVGPGYFTTLGMPMRNGREFDARDREDGTPVAIISATVAQRAWPGADPIGKHIKLGPPDSRGAWHTVVGIVDETRYRDLTTAQPTLYLPTRQFGGPVPMTLAVRTGAGLPSPVPQMRATLRALHPDLAIASGGSMSMLLDAPLARPRFSAFLFGSVALVTLFLAVVGIYGALAATVRERRRELGIRLALGATARMVTTLVLRQGMRLTVLGCALGLAGAWATTRLLHTMLYGISPTDPFTYGLVPAIVLATAAVACWIPARRAGRVDPIRVLREE